MTYGKTRQRSPEVRPARVRARGGFPTLLAILVGWTLSALALQSAPVILHLKNGDRLTGEILSESGARLVLKSPSLGRMKVSLDDIDRREAPSSTAAAAPAASTAAKPSAASTPLPHGTVASNTPPSSWFAPAWVRPLLTNWHGNIQLGMDLGFGTTDRQTYYGNAAANHTYDRFRNNLSVRSAYGTAEAPVSAAAPKGTVQTANSLEGLWKTDFDLGVHRKVYLYHQVGAGFDEIRRHALRIEDGAGLGYKLVQRPRLTVNAELGGQYQHFSYLNGPTRLPFLKDNDSFSARVGENLTWKASDKLSITHRLQITPNVEDLGDFRARFELGLSYPLLKKVTLSLNVFDEYESRPAGRVENNQLQIQSTVGITF